MVNAWRSLAFELTSLGALPVTLRNAIIDETVGSYWELSGIDANGGYVQKSQVPCKQPSKLEV